MTANIYSGIILALCVYICFIGIPSGGGIVDNGGPTHVVVGGGGSSKFPGKTLVVCNNYKYSY